MKNLIKNESGQSMVEYGLIIGLIAVVALVFLTDLGQVIAEKFRDIRDALQNAGN